MKDNILDLVESLLTDTQFVSQVQHKICDYPACAKILEEGETHPDLYIIRSGMVRISLTGNIVKTIHPGVADLEKGDVFGEFSLFEDVPASADVSTVTETQLIKIDIPSFRKYLDNNPDVGYRFLHTLFLIFVNRIRMANRSVLRLLEWGLNAHELDKHL